MNLYGYQLGSHIQEGGTAERVEGRIHKKGRRPADCGTGALSWEDTEFKLSLAV